LSGRFIRELLHFAVTELGTTLKNLAIRFAISEQAIGPAVERGKRIAEKKGLKLT